MQILTQNGGLASTNCWLIADETTNQAVLFDAPDHTVAPLLAEAKRRGWDLIGLWLTHGHFDHIADHPLVTQRFPNAKVLIHPLDQPKLPRPQPQPSPPRPPLPSLPPSLHHPPAHPRLSPLRKPAPQARLPRRPRPP